MASANRISDKEPRFDKHAYSAGLNGLDGLDGLNGLNGSLNHHEGAPTNSWSAPGPAEFDFRSDTVTTPTASMLSAITGSSLLDDVFREDPTTTSLESYVADLTGHEAGLLVLSGTMGNQLSIRTHLAQPPHSVLADARSHIMGWEAGGIASLSGALALPIEPTNNHHLTLADIKRHAVTSTDVHACPTRLICLENTLAGTILPLSACQGIAAWARARTPPILLHLDGARLWEAVVAGTGSLKEYAACFDSVSLCFSKGLGAPIGSIIVGSRAFCERARHVRKALGGGLRQAGVISAAARASVEETFLGGSLRRSHERARKVARMWVEKGGRVQKACETNMVWLDLEGAGKRSSSREQEGEERELNGNCERKEVDGAELFAQAALAEGVKVKGGRLVVHYQISEEAVRRLGRAMDRVLARKGVELNGHIEERKSLKRKAEEVMAPEVE